jgi:predicted transcriptional regulator
MKTGKDILKLDSRRKIYEFIDENPALNFREISRKMNIPKSTLIYHLNYLKKLRLINEKHKGKYSYFFVLKKVGEKDKILLSLIREKTSFKIFVFICFFKFCSQSQLCRELNIPSSTISYYIKKMVAIGLIEHAPVKNGRIYPYVHLNDSSSGNSFIEC